MWTSFVRTPGLVPFWRNEEARKPLARGRIGVEPARGFEPRTCALRMHCSTTELSWLFGRWCAGTRRIAPILVLGGSPTCPDKAPTKPRQSPEEAPPN